MKTKRIASGLFLTGIALMPAALVASLVFKASTSVAALLVLLGLVFISVGMCMALVIHGKANKKHEPTTKEKVVLGVLGEIFKILLHF